MPDRINASLTPAQKQAALAALDSARQNLPFLLDLSPEERRRLPHIGESALPFIQKCLEIALQHPEILRGSFDLAGLRKDVVLERKIPF